MKKKKQWWIWIVTALYIWLIFRNSMMNADASEGLSLNVTDYILHVLHHFGLYAYDEMLFNHYIRKLAHFTEFAGLGFLITIAMQICPVFSHRWVNFVLFLFAIPFADETIQSFSAGRSDQFSDMVLDGCGYLAGGLFCWILFLIIRDLFRKRKTS